VPYADILSPDRKGEGLSHPSYACVARTISLQTHQAGKKSWSQVWVVEVYTEVKWRECRTKGRQECLDFAVQDDPATQLLLLGLLDRQEQLELGRQLIFRI